MIRAGLKISVIVLLAAMLFGCAGSPQARKAKFLSRGKDLIEKKDYSRALLEFRNAAKADPNDAEVFYQLGIAFMGVRDGRSAYAAFHKAVLLNPKHAAAQLKIAQLQTTSDNPEILKDAEDRLKTLLQDGAPTADTLNTLAFTELKLGNSQGAIQTFEQALAQAPQELFSAVMLARAKLSTNDVKGAEAVLQKAVASSPQSADARALLGEFYLGQNNAAAAEKALREAVALDPKSGGSLLGLGRLEFAQGRKAEAEQTLKQLTAIDGYQSTFGLYLYQTGRGNEAIAEFERLAKEHPDDRQMRTNLVIAYRTAGRSADADRVLAQALKKNPKDGEALLQRAEIAIGAARYTDAEADLNQLLKLRPNAPEAHYVLGRLNLAKGMVLTYRHELLEVLRLNPDLLPARVELAQHFNSEKQPQAALDLADNAPAYQRSAIPLLVQWNWALWAMGNMAEMRKGIDQGLAAAKSVDLLVQDGMWKLRDGNPAGARVPLEQALNLDSGDIRALMGIQQSYMAQKNAPLAVQKMKELAAQYPQSSAIQHFLGMMLAGTGDKAKARAAFEAARAADPKSTTSELPLIQMDILEGKSDEAQKRLDGILAKESGNKTARLWLADVQLMRGQNDLAIDSFQKVVAADPGNAQAYNNLAYLLIDKRPDDALKYAQKAVELMPDWPAYCDTLGWALYQKGLYASAIKYLEHADQAKGDPVWSYHLAMAYAKSGDATRSRQILQAALKRDPNVPEAKMAQDIVERGN